MVIRSRQSFAASAGPAPGPAANDARRGPASAGLVRPAPRPSRLVPADPSGGAARRPRRRAVSPRSAPGPTAPPPAPPAPPPRPPGPPWAPGTPGLRAADTRQPAARRPSPREPARKHGAPALGAGGEQARFSRAGSALIRLAGRRAGGPAGRRAVGNVPQAWAAHRRRSGRATCPGPGRSGGPGDPRGAAAGPPARRPPPQRSSKEAAAGITLVQTSREGSSVEPSSLSMFLFSHLSVEPSSLSMFLFSQFSFCSYAKTVQCFIHLYFLLD